jgi:tetratricopeptide (TPR) repeat protein
LAIKADDSVAIGWGILGDCLNDLNRPLEAIECFLKATSLDPSIGALWSGLARAKVEGKDYEAAVKDFERAIAIVPTAARYNLLANALGELGRMSEGEEALRKALEIDPNREDAKSNMERLLNSR